LRFQNVRQRLYWRIARSARRVHGRGPLLVAIGDSHTDPASGYTLPWQVWLRRVGREGYKTVNLGFSGDTTTDMRRRIEQMLDHGQPSIAVVFGGTNDALRHIDPEETKRNVAFMVKWLGHHGIRKLVVIGPGLVNWRQDSASVSAVDDLRTLLGDVAARNGASFVDLAGFLGDRIDRGEDPDFRRLPYRQSRSWHVRDGDPHFNAYGQRLIAEAFLVATAGWRRPTRARRLTTKRRP
jgi:lysophospholipase L1-like esterase